MGFRRVYLLSIFVVVRVEAVPPEACFANFRWDDCGKSPVPVMYYWKPGSRCEVGLWRGCLPNINMFPDEYECVTTCIFTARAMPEDYHSMHENEIEDKTEYSTQVVTETNASETTMDSATTGGDSGGAGSQATGASGADGSGGDNKPTGDVATTAAGGGGDAATTEAPAAK